MKKLLFILLVFCLSLSIHAQTKIDFYKTEEYKAALKQAKKEKKSIFIDFTAEWRLPCKQMEKTTFTNPSLIKYLNQNFISIRVDGSLFAGMEISERFSVEEYPTFLILNEKGKVKKRLTGYQTSYQLITTLKRYQH